MNVATRAAQGIAFPEDAPATARSALRLLQNLRHGALTLYLPDGSQRRFGEHPQQHTLHTPRHPSASITCLLYTSPSPRDRTRSRMPSSA